MHIYINFLKRIFDILLALIVLLILSPGLVIVALLVRVNLGSPIIFKQQRPGINEEIFTIYKFRTMTNATDANGELLPCTERLTKFGRMLRSTSLDELPEIYNILKGDMSFVGPRPLAKEYLPYYTEQERLRHTVKPGLTGLAQINGRNIASWEQRFHYDLEYVNNITFLRDLKIIFLTLFKVIQRDSIGEPGVEDPEDFDQYRQAQFYN